MHNRIHILPESIVSQIAAGEVIERPASIIKELMENSIDAGSTSITVKIDRTGFQKIEVADNGCGMNEPEVQSAFKLHSTSKISSINDIDDLKTLGFRGEALASIASIANVEVHTKDSKNPAVTFRMNNNRSSTSLGPNRNHGTAFRISGLFQNIPVRKKFIKSPETEYRHILETFINIALPNPDIEFKLYKENSLIYDLRAVNDQLKRICSIFKTISPEQLIPINYDEPRTTITGFITHPVLANTKSHDQYIFLNKRYIRDPVLNKAVREGYGTALMHNAYPSFFINLNLDPRLYDVNVHPRKLEVRFVNTGRLYSIIAKTTQYALEKELTREYAENFAAPVLKTYPKQPVYKGSFPQDKNISTSLNFTKTILSQSELLFSESQTLTGSPIKAMQVFNTYIIIEKDNKLLLIDQHAAHERINYEKIISELQILSGPKSLQLLVPVILKMTDTSFSRLKTYKKTLFEIGYSFNFLPRNTVEIITIPQFTEKQNQEELIGYIVSDLENTAGSNKYSISKLTTKAVSTIACHSSIRAGQKLTDLEMENIINGLFRCKLPYSCPHGRPIVWELTKTKLEENFKRKL